MDPVTISGPQRVIVSGEWHLVRFKRILDAVDTGGPDIGTCKISW